jgi:hypothetical protein
MADIAAATIAARGIPKNHYSCEGGKMSFIRIPDGALERNSQFASRDAVTGSDPDAVFAPNIDRIVVLENGFWVAYRRVTGATDLIAGDFSTWQRASLTQADLASLAGDLVASISSVINVKGVWTPGLSWSAGGGSFTYYVSEGRFDRIADLVSVRANLVFSIGAGGTGNLQLTNLPFTTRSGAFADSLSVDFDSFSMQTPIGGSQVKVRVAGGYNRGVFTYDAGTNIAAVFVTSLSAIPRGNGTLVTIGGTGKTAQILDFSPHPEIANAGWVHLGRRFGEITNGTTLTGLTWAGIAVTDVGTSWFGAESQTSFWDRSLLPTGDLISLELSGVITV